MAIYGSNSLVGAGLQELGRDHLFDGEDDAVLAADADGGATILNSLDSVLDLEVAAVGGEDGVEEIVAGAYRRLDAESSQLSWLSMGEDGGRSDHDASGLSQGERASWGRGSYVFGEGS